MVHDLCGKIDLCVMKNRFFRVVKCSSDEPGIIFSELAISTFHIDSIDGLAAHCVYKYLLQPAFDLFGAIFSRQARLHASQQLAFEFVGPALTANTGQFCRPFRIVPATNTISLQFSADRTPSVFRCVR